MKLILQILSLLIIAACNVSYSGRNTDNNIIIYKKAIEIIKNYDSLDIKFSNSNNLNYSKVFVYDSSIYTQLDVWDTFILKNAFELQTDNPKYDSLKKSILIDSFKYYDKDFHSKKLNIVNDFNYSESEYVIYFGNIYKNTLIADVYEKDPNITIDNYNSYLTDFWLSFTFIIKDNNIIAWKVLKVYS